MCTARLLGSCIHITMAICSTMFSGSSQVTAATMAASSGAVGMGSQGEPSGSQGPGGRRAPSSFASQPQPAAGGASRGGCFKYAANQKSAYVTCLKLSWARLPSGDTCPSSCRFLDSSIQGQNPFAWSKRSCNKQTAIDQQLDTASGRKWQHTCETDHRSAGWLELAIAILDLLHSCMAGPLP